MRRMIAFASGLVFCALSLLFVSQAVMGGEAPIVRIQSLQSGKCMDVSRESMLPSAFLVQWACHQGDNQHFRLLPTADGALSLVAQHSGKCLAIPAGNTDAGTPCIQWECHGRENQQFILQPVEGAEANIFRITARHSGQCLDVVGGSMEDGAKIVQWPCNESAHQLWRVLPAP